MNIWHGIEASRVSAEQFVAVVEISKGGKNKYELDKATGMLRLDRVLFTSTHYPANYGFIPLTYGDDNDPLDVLVLCSESIMPMTLVNCRPIGVLKMSDEGQQDEKVIAVCVDDPHYNSYHDIEELPGHLFAEIRHFYEVYKMLEDKHTLVKEICGKETAVDIINNGLQQYQENKERLMGNA